MNKALKITLITVGLLAVGTSTYFIARAIRRKNEREEEEEKQKEENKKELEQAIDNLNSQSSNGSANASCEQIFVKPDRNLNKDINNSFSDIKGVTLYPALKSSDPIKGHKYASGYTNIRNSAEVNNKTSSFDVSNLIGKVSSGSPIGKIVAESYDDQSPKHRWFKVLLAKKMEDCSGVTGGFFGCDEATVGYVRADTVSFKPINKTSKECQIKKMCQGATPRTDNSIDQHIYSGFQSLSVNKKQKACSSAGSSYQYFDGGDMVERYAPVRLGAEVFPHSNWMLPNSFRHEYGDRLTDL